MQNYTTKNMYQNCFKRILDVGISMVLLTILMPCLIIVSCILVIQFRASPFFIQERPGRGERKISVIKFKTMTDSKGQDGSLLPNHLRITKIGSFLRKYSIDELPQLINVLGGEMSLVGPRPLLFKYIPLYTDEQKRRHQVKPGITGLAQVNGRNAISWNQKFEYDIYYVNNLSLRMDLAILFETFLKVVKADGINFGQDTTMPPFNGSN